MLLLNLLLLTGVAVANPALNKRQCSTPSYTPVAGFPQGSTTTLCYDTSYYRAADQGQITDTDLPGKCESLCTADSSCTAIVAAVQYAADSNLATGVCYFYNHTPSPRQCTDSSKRALYADQKNCVVTTTTVSTTQATTSSSTTAKATTTSSSTTTKATTTSSSTTTKATTTSSSTTTKATTTSSSTTTKATTTSSSTTTKATTTSSSTTTKASTTSSSTTTKATTTSSSTTTKATTTSSSSSTTTKATTTSSTTSSSTTSSTTTPSTTSSSTTTSSTTTSSTTTSSTTTSSTTTSSTTTSSTTTSSTTTAPAPTPTPVQCSTTVCDQASADAACGGSCYCVPNYPTKQGYCTNISGSHDTCKSNADCSSTENCFDVCGSGLCLSVSDCENTASPQRLFVRSSARKLVRGQGFTIV